MMKGRDRLTCLKMALTVSPVRTHLELDSESDDKGETWNHRISRYAHTWIAQKVSNLIVDDMFSYFTRSTSTRVIGTSLWIIAKWLLLKLRLGSTSFCNTL